MIGSFARAAYTKLAARRSISTGTRASRPPICAIGRAACCWPRQPTTAWWRSAARDVLRRLYPQAQLHSFPQGRHADTVHSPAAQIAMLRAFLRRLEGCAHARTHPL
ncbi:MAG: hypothetical protein U0074_08850 [Kouleothrix sp.]